VRLLLLAWLAGCSPKPEVVVYTSVDQVFSEPVFDAFEAASGVTVRAVFDTEEAKSTGVLNRLLAEADAPQADVFWSGDPIRPFLLAQRGLLEAYASPEAAGIPAAYKAADGSWTGVAARARMLLVNRDLVPEAETPHTLRELTGPAWTDRVAIANPLYGTTTMHVAALMVAWGEAPARAWLDGLKVHGAWIAASNGEVRRLVVAGDVAVGLLDTDDAAEAVASGAHVEGIFPADGTLVMPSSVVLLRGGPHPAEARKLADWLISARTEEAMAAHGAHMPLRAGVVAPAGVVAVGSIPALAVDYQAVAREMEASQPWLKAWAGL
jgi:iron(III) transport system substrate-binding protein